jgi:hypothetical protein
VPLALDLALKITSFMIKPQYFARLILEVCDISIKMKSNATCRKLPASSNLEQHYQVRFFYDWGCDSPFWCGNEAARSKFGVGPIEPEELGLSAEISEQLRSLRAWHDTALDWDDPLGPSPWTPEECDRFNAVVSQLLELIRAELSEEYEIIRDRDLW